jgi:hypothetical protein
VICPTGKSVQFCLMSLRASASRGEKSRAPKFQFREPIQADLGRPDVLQKIFRFARDPKSNLQILGHPASTSGASRSSRTLEAGCGGRFGGALTNEAEADGKGVSAPRCWR